MPDNGNTEFFINLNHNKHLDKAYGGYCVFAEVANDAAMQVCQAIAKAIPKGAKRKIASMSIVEPETGS